MRIENVFILELMVWPFGSIVLLRRTPRGNRIYSYRNMVTADQIVDSSSTNNNSNNDREVDGDFKRVNEVFENSKACVVSKGVCCE